MELVIAALITVILALLWIMDRKDTRAQEERKTWQLERANLLQRIQAPEVVIQRQAVEQAEPLAPAEADLGPWELPPYLEDDE